MAYSPPLAAMTFIPSLLSDQQMIERAIVLNPLSVDLSTPLMAVIALMSQVRSSCTLLDGTETVETVHQLQEARASCVLVTEQRQIRGILTERDVVRLAAADQSLENLTIADVMTSPVVTVPLADIGDIFSALNVLRQHHIRHLPVVDEQDQAIGLLTPESIRGLLQPADLLRLRVVSEVMATDVIQALPTTSMLDLAHLMATHRVSCVVIVAAPQVMGATQQSVSPVGIVTERDIVQFQALGLAFRQIQAQMVMSCPLFCLQPDTSLWASHQLMQKHRVRRLVVTNDQNEMVGLVTQTSLLQVISPVEVYSLVEVLQQKVTRLEAERIELLQTRAEMLEHQVEARTMELQQQVECDRLVANLSAQIYQSFDLSQILQVTVEQVRHYLQVDQVLVCQCNPDCTSHVVAESVAVEWPSCLGQAIPAPWVTRDWLDASRKGRVRIVTDRAPGEMVVCPGNFPVDRQVCAQILVPIIHDGQLWGMLMAQHYATPRLWSTYEVETLTKLSTQVAIAIQQTELYTRTQIDLQERQKAEEALRQERNFADAILNVAGALVVVLDRQGRIVRFNQTCEQITGYSFEEVRGKVVWDNLLIPEEQHSVLAVFHQLVMGQCPTQHEHHWVTKTGEQRLITWSNTTLTDIDGAISYVIATGIDVTEQRLAEARLRTSEATNRALLAGVPDLMMRVRRDGTYLDFIPAKNFTTFMATPNMVGQKLQATMPAHLAQQRMAIIERALQTGELQTYEFEVEIDGSVQVEEVRVVVSEPDEVFIIVRDVTQRRQAEAQLRQSEQRYITLAQAAPVGIFRSDAEGHFFYVNDRWREITGLNGVDSQGLDWVNGVHPEDRASVVDTWLRTTQTHQPFRLEYRFQRPDGKVSWVFGQAVAELDATGKTIGYIGTITDISDRQRSEMALKSLVEGTASVTGKDFFAVLVRYIAEALEVRHVIVAKRLHAGEMQTLALWSDGQLHPNRCFDTTHLPCGITLQKGRYGCAEQLQQVFPDQPLLNHFAAQSYQGVALQNSAGQAIGTLCILHDQELSDLTRMEAILRVFAARAAAELERQEVIEALEQLNHELEDRVEQRTAALRESEARFRVMADSAPVFLWMSDTTASCNFFNQTWLTFTGRSLADELGSGWAERLHPDDFQRCLEMYLRHFAVRQSFQMEYRLQRHDGEYRWLLDTGTPRFAPDGSFEGYIGSCVDISDRKQAEAQLQSSLQEKEVLLKEIHHRVKNNLLVVASLLDWQTDYIQDPVILKIFEESQHRIHSMALIHEKLYQSRNLDRIDLGEYLRTLAEHLFFSFDLDPNIIRFQYDFASIFLNIETATPCGLIVSELISNVLKHAFPGGQAGQVWVTVRESVNHQITVSIRDNGIGFSETVDFRNTESLGLQLVCLLTKQIQGNIELIRNRGTEFRLTFAELNYQRRL